MEPLFSFLNDSRHDLHVGVAGSQFAQKISRLKNTDVQKLILEYTVKA